MKGSNGLANHPVVSFDRLDSQQLVGKVEGMSGLTRLTLSAVIRTNDTTEATPIGAIDWGMHFNLVIGGASVGKVLAVFDGDTANNLEGHLSEASINDGEGQIVTMSSDGNKTRLFINGLDESVYGETLSGPTEDFAVGNQFGTSRYFSGDIAEIVIYDRKLELEDRLALECIFADKFKISIAQPCNLDARVLKISQSSIVKILQWTICFLDSENETFLPAPQTSRLAYSSHSNSPLQNMEEWSKTLSNDSALHVSASDP